MTATLVSQRTLVETWRVFNGHDIKYCEEIYALGFPAWFVARCTDEYEWHWDWILKGLRSLEFFYRGHDSFTGHSSIIGRPLAKSDASVLGERAINTLVLFAATLPGSEKMVRSLELDGLSVDHKNGTLVPLEGPVRAQEEEDRLSSLVTTSRIQNGDVIKRHIADAHQLYTQGKDHPSLNESRNLIQALIERAKRIRLQILRRLVCKVPRQCA